jgi:murein L,D-transpeptidase YafK
MHSLLSKSIVASLIGISMSATPVTFLEEQLKFERVNSAYEEKEQTLKQTLGRHKISIDKLNLLIVACKDSDELDVYGKNTDDVSFKKILSYRVCARSGTLGPKSRRGDDQVPEGFYYIDRFNPKSNFHLSLGLNYPNQADKKRNGTTHDLGGDIFIHGACVTIGCLPMTDYSIKEIYVLAAHARSNGQTKIPVYIFPFRMTKTNLRLYGNRYKSHEKLVDFWKNLAEGYDRFMQDYREVTFHAKADGSYEFDQ